METLKIENTEAEVCQTLFTLALADKTDDATRSNIMIKIFVLKILK